MTFLYSVNAMKALGRIGECDEVQGQIQFLASNASAYVTCTEIIMDGGHTIMNKSHPRVVGDYGR